MPHPPPALIPLRSGVSITQLKFCNTADLNGIVPSIKDGGCATIEQIQDAVHNKVRPLCVISSPDATSAQDGSCAMALSLTGVLKPGQCLIRWHPLGAAPQRHS